MEVKTVPTPAGRPTIQSYGADGFRISGTVYGNPIFVFPDGVVDWQVATPIGADSFATAVGRRADFDLLLVGCGTRCDGFSLELAATLRDQGLHCELMATGAACRTYNLLVAEGRRVAAALLPLNPRN
jgi:uncharacterized protein